MSAAPSASAIVTALGTPRVVAALDALIDLHVTAIVAWCVEAAPARPVSGLKLTYLAGRAPDETQATDYLGLLPEQDLDALLAGPEAGLWTLWSAGDWPIEGPLSAPESDAAAIVWRSLRAARVQEPERAVLNDVATRLTRQSWSGVMAVGSHFAAWACPPDPDASVLENFEASADEPMVRLFREAGALRLPSTI